MKNKTITLLALTMLIFGCGSSPREEVLEEGAHQHQHETESIALDNGKKWKVDEHMLVYIQTMEKEVLNFNGTTLAEYQALSKSLKKNIGLLTSNCAMKGKAHDELHKWLLPYISLSEEFSASQTEQKAALLYQKIKESFTIFNTSFE